MKRSTKTFLLVGLLVVPTMLEAQVLTCVYKADEAVANPTGCPPKEVAVRKMEPGSSVTVEYSHDVAETLNALVRAPSGAWWFLARNINRENRPEAFGPYPSESFCRIAANALMPLNERFWDAATRKRNEDYIARYGALTTGPVFHDALTVCVLIPTVEGSR